MYFKLSFLRYNLGLTLNFHRSANLKGGKPLFQSIDFLDALVFLGSTSTLTILLLLILIITGLLGGMYLLPVRKSKSLKKSSDLTSEKTENLLAED